MDHSKQPGIIPVTNQQQSSATRETKEGRRLTYRLNVIQQPARARACGSGSKSSADRRPVDPPPIVALKIFETKGPNQEDDITYTMHANYFLFATLEQARHQSHGRVSADRTQPTVLTGTPVAGMAYLDRPEPAGYFIFPDLSVRHEGKYRLSFSLYEELKDTKDEDKNADPAPSAASDAHVTHRLEVKSEPFTVFSAKKFPGLASSTSLSRVVAEQGCRVRIRRDVRMRKRDSKPGKDWDGYEDETAHVRARMSVTPVPDHYSYTSHGSIEPVARPRSPSSASHHSMSAPVSRRPSLQELNHSYQQQPPYSAAPQTPTHGYSQQQHPPPYGPSPTQQYPPQYVQSQPQAPQQQQHMHPPPPPPPPHYQQPQGYSQPPAPPPPASSQYPPYGYTPASATSTSPQHYPPHSQYDQIRSTGADYSQQRQSEHGRTSMPQVPPPPPPANYMPQQSYHGQSAPQDYPAPPPPPPPQHGSYSSHGPQGYGSVDSYSSRPAHQPEVSAMQPPARNSTGSGSTLSSRPSFGSNTLPPLTTSNLLSGGGKLEASSPMSAGPPSSTYFPTPQSATDPSSSHKRSFGDVFPQMGTYNHQPLKAGARPTSSAAGPTTPATSYDSYPGKISAYAGANPAAADEDDDDAECDVSSNLPRVSYRRADGKYVVSTWNTRAV